MAMKLVYLVSITFILILVLPSISSADNKYAACGILLQCGNIKDIGYPFWGDSRPDYCGHPSYHLTDCQPDKSPVIEINDVTYRVLTIDTYIHSLRLVRSDYSDTVCPQYLQNGTMIKDYQFSYVDYTKDLIIYYNCTRGAGVLPQPNQFLCFLNGSSSEAFYALSGVALIEGVSCESSVSIRVDSIEASNINTASFNTASFNVTQVIMNGFSLSWDAHYNDCEKCAQDGGRCGSNPSSSSLVCYARNESIGSKFRPPGIGFILIVVFGSITILTLILCIMRRYSRSLVSCMERPGNEDVDEFVRIYGSFAPKRYTYLNVKKITNSFNEKLGQGGCGVVYKGKLPDGRQVAVKVLSETKENREDFFNEVVSIGRTSHVNIVTLLGFCVEKNKRALIYEYMVRGSLEKAVREKLEWTTLYQIAIGVAHGLEYLHRGCNTRIVHFDIKPHNILLDENLNPKISDFGLAKLLQSQQSKISMLVARGTAGYIAPEVLSRAFGPVSHKSDVYSYGMLLIEMTGAEKNKKGVVLTSEMYFPDWIYEHLERDEDLDFHGVTNKEDEEMAKKMVVVGLWCIQTNPLDRPPISQVVNMLKGDLESLQIPPKPVLFSPPIAYLNSENSSPILSSSIANVPEKEG